MISVSFDPRQMKLVRDEAEKQVRFATSVAINRTASVAKDALKVEMAKVFDRPNPFTMNALKFNIGNKNKPKATLWFKDRFWYADGEFLTGESRYKHYLEPQVYGGSRPFKNFEAALYKHLHLPKGWFAVPGMHARLDRYGNMSSGQIVQILSGLRVFGEVGYIANRSRRAGAKRTKTNSIEYVVVHPGEAKKPGVWIRRKDKFELVLAFVKTVRYQKRFDFFGVANKTIQREIGAQFKKALADAASSAR
ncbi:MAG: hypothetical protein HQL97_01230 [Magnetococcales bacterium]|nr:hypothetical protein [Magnetococcales bacterium]